MSKLRMDYLMDIEIKVTGDEEVTLAQLSMPGLRHEIVSTGSAKRHYKDKYDGLIARDLSTARALRAAAEEMEARAWARIDFNNAKR